MAEAPGVPDSHWPLWEVFTQGTDGEPFEHAGSLHAADAEHALQNARDVYTRRGEAVHLWVVPSAAITASAPSDAGPFSILGTTRRIGIRSSTRPRAASASSDGGAGA